MTATVKDDLVIKALKARYFALVPTEDFPRSPAITTELDNLETAIRELQPKPNTNPQPKAP